MKLALLILGISIISCGKKDDNDGTCKNKETARIECRVVHSPNYGDAYAREMCNRTYSSDRCY